MESNRNLKSLWLRLRLLFIFKVAITITISIANQKGNRLGNRKSNRSDCLSLLLIQNFQKLRNLEILNLELEFILESDYRINRRYEIEEHQCLIMSKLFDQMICNLPSSVNSLSMSIYQYGPSRVDIPSNLNEINLNEHFQLKYWKCLFRDLVKQILIVILIF